ncbi:MAG: MucB/RseB C-terminal domain-containing protein [Gammaproteobacteria bacterium]|nr:MucB/RseB C-terminal domain-containing protein [Gammaproteobacteria bacterium]
MFKIVFLLFLSLTSLAVSASEVDDWLDKMSVAMKRQNYQGTLIIRQDDNLQAIKVKQGVEVGESWQTLESQTGEDQIIIRNNDSVTSIFPAKKLITVSTGKDAKANKGPLHSGLPDNRDKLKQYYVLKLGNEARVANKVTQIMQMTPRDNHRYGYTFWLDKSSGLLLKCDLLNNKGRVLEQQMYSEIELLSSAPLNQIDESKLLNFKKVTLSNKTDITSNTWVVEKMPAGFTLIRSVKTDKQEPAYHMVYSDGMASVSVFIEPTNVNMKTLKGRSSMGPVNAYSSYSNGAYITAIGEVPESTVRMIAQSTHPVH